MAEGTLYRNTMLVVLHMHAQTYASFDKVFLYQHKLYGNLP